MMDCTASLISRRVSLRGCVKGRTDIPISELKLLSHIYRTETLHFRGFSVALQDDGITDLLRKPQQGENDVRVEEAEAVQRRASAFHRP